MTHPLVDDVLGYIKDNWSAGSFGDIPLERINRDDSDNLDGNIRSHTEDLQANNYVGAAHVDRSPEPIGTGYDHRVESVVGVRIEGLHKTEYGKIDPSASLPPATANDPVPWYDLWTEIQDAILTERSEPSTTSSVDLSLQITNEEPDAASFGDYYRYDFDVVFTGYEDLP